MSYVIAVAGKGGVGKTTITTLLIRYLAATNGPVLAIDADPNISLDIALGLKSDETISDIREESKKLVSTSLSKSEYFNMRLQEIITESKGLDLLTMGRPEGPGCYCAINNILREFLLKLNTAYKFVVIDNEAGMEHLSRRTANIIDRLVLVSDVTIVGLRSAINAFDTANKAGVKIKKASLLINKSKSSLTKDKINILKEADLAIDGYIPYDEAIAKRSEEGLPVEKAENQKLIDIFKKLIS